MDGNFPQQAEFVLLDLVDSIYNSTVYLVVAKACEPRCSSWSFQQWRHNEALIGTTYCQRSCTRLGGCVRREWRQWR